MAFTSHITTKCRAFSSYRAGQFYYFSEVCVRCLLIVHKLPLTVIRNVFKSVKSVNIMMMDAVPTKQPAAGVFHPAIQIKYFIINHLSISFL